MDDYRFLHCIFLQSGYIFYDQEIKSHHVKDCCKFSFWQQTLNLLTFSSRSLRSMGSLKRIFTKSTRNASEGKCPAQLSLLTTPPPPRIPQFPQSPHVHDFSQSRHFLSQTLCRRPDTRCWQLTDISPFFFTLPSPRPQTPFFLELSQVNLPNISKHLSFSLFPD